MTETPTNQALAGAVALALLLGGCGGPECSKNPAPPECRYQIFLTIGNEYSPPPME